MGIGITSSFARVQQIASVHKILLHWNFSGRSSAGKDKRRSELLPFRCAFTKFPLEDVNSRDTRKEESKYFKDGVCKQSSP